MAREQAEPEAGEGEPGDQAAGLLYFSAGMTARRPGVRTDAELPAPVAAPGNGEIAVGWLCVSTLKTVCVSSSRGP